MKTMLFYKITIANISFFELARKIERLKSILHDLKKTKTTLCKIAKGGIENRKTLPCKKAIVKIEYKYAMSHAVCNLTKACKNMVNAKFDS